MDTLLALLSGPQQVTSLESSSMLYLMRDNHVKSENAQLSSSQLLPGKLRKHSFTSLPAAALQI